MSGYSPAEKAVYAEAIRAVPAIATAKARGRKADAAALYRMVEAEARERGLDPETSWSIMAAASVSWFEEMVSQFATLSGKSGAEILGRCIGLGVEWAMADD